jgi:hypothetical protein
MYTIASRSVGISQRRPASVAEKVENPRSPRRRLYELEAQRTQLNQSDS